MPQQEQGHVAEKRAVVASCNSKPTLEAEENGLTDGLNLKLSLCIDRAKALQC